MLDMELCGRIFAYNIDVKYPIIRKMLMDYSSDNLTGVSIRCASLKPGLCVAGMTVQYKVIIQRCDTCSFVI